MGTENLPVAHASFFRIAFRSWKSVNRWFPYSIYNQVVFYFFFLFQCLHQHFAEFPRRHFRPNLSDVLRREYAERIFEMDSGKQLYDQEGTAAGSNLNPAADLLT